MAQALDILIAGGGIGGLTAALALQARGHRVTICEAAAQLRPLGVGINLLPHAVAVLDELGLLPALRAMAVETSALVFANRHGQTIYRDPRGLAGGYSHPQLSIHRGELQLLLWHTAEVRLGAAALHSGERIKAAREDGDQVVAEIECADGSRRERRADLLIAADGIHSAIRRQHFPDEGAPRWNGMMMWRGTSWARPFLDGQTMVQAGHRRAKFVVYPIAPPRAGDRLQLINWIADRRLREDGIGGGLSAPSREDWSKPGLLADLLPTFGHWHFDWLDVPGLMQAHTQLLEWPMVDRDPLPHWRLGQRITLLGDAAHPMYPIGSNGATQAILDAQTLAAALSLDNALPAALDAYERERLPLCAKIVEMNRQEGLDAILDMAEERAPAGFARLEDVINPAEIDAYVKRYKAAAGHRQSTATPSTEA
jgi:2-polyprenyl-6-methoxyphenol hydroxylase-like FAD-dependent oxidoreductase